jgi:uncharacterized protein (TIGR03083 family)
MAASSPWPLIHGEREALAADLATLTDEQWATGSLCPGWSVRDVLGHMIATAKMTPAAFFPALARSGFRFNDMSDRLIAAEATTVPADGLVEFRKHLKDTTHPPGPAESMLGEAVVHSEDIRRPLGIKRAYQPEAVTRAADFFRRSNLLIGSKRRVAGLSLRANDLEWAAGSGPEVTGPALSLLMAMTGRAAVLGDLSGEGLPTLAGRMDRRVTA